MPVDRECLPGMHKALDRVPRTTKTGGLGLASQHRGGEGRKSRAQLPLIT